ncbi:extracellular calcium-sensing receptor-like [Lissotriton helveticus]
MMDRACRLPINEVTGLSRDGDLILGGIFPLHDDVEFQQANFTVTPAPITCQSFRTENYQAIQAVIFAVEEINRNPFFLPNVSLGVQIYDSCRMRQRSLEGTLWMLAGKKHPAPNFRCQQNLPLVGIIGDAGSSSSIVMARVLGLYRFPQISYVSSSPLLTDRNQFPSFFRTIPNDNFQSHGLTQLLVHFGWTWVGLLIEDNDYGQQGANVLKLELANARACIAFSENIILSRADRNALHIIQVIKSSKANAIVIFSSDAGVIPLLDEIMKHNITGKVWIASEGWSTSKVLLVEKYSQILTGTIGFATYSGEIPGFAEHLNSVHPSRSTDDIFLMKFWEEAFGCKWVNAKESTSLWKNSSTVCTGNENLDKLHIDYNDVTNFRAQYNTYTAVYATAWALHNLNSCSNREHSVLNEMCADILTFKPWQLLHFVKNVHFKNKDGHEVSFNQFGEIPAQYDIINFQQNADGTLRHVRVGRYDSSASEGQVLSINTSAILWASGVAQIPSSVCTKSCSPGFRKAEIEGEPLCCFRCVQCPLGEISNQTDSADCLKCPWDRWPNVQQDLCIPKSTEYLSYQDTLAVILAVICIFCSLIPSAMLCLFVQNRNTPIVKANNRSLSFLLLVSLSLCFLCSLAFIGFPTPEKCLLRQVAFGIIFALCISCILAKTIMVVIAFNATKPNSNLRRWVRPQLSYVVTICGTLIQIFICVSWLSLSPPFSQNNILTHPGTIIIECNEGSPIAFWFMLGYLGFLATVSFIVAFLARKLPDSFNEAKFITFSMLAFLSVWLSFIPAYLSTKGKYMVAMEIFAILSSGSALVFCIFLPKCYIILLRPEINTKEYLMGKEKGQSNKDKIS